jgi:hypothetical protein
MGVVMEFGGEGGRAGLLMSFRLLYFALLFHIITTSVNRSLLRYVGQQSVFGDDANDT